MFIINRNKLSSLLIAFSFFQFGIMQPIAILMGSQIIIALTTLIIFGLLFILFKFNIHRYVYFIFIFTTLLFFINYFIFNGREVILLIFLEFILKSFSLVLIGSFKFSTKELEHYFSVFSLINFVSLLIIVVLGFIETFNYMRFGYALLPTLLFAIYSLRISRNKLLWTAIAIASFILILFYGSRGPLIGILFFITIIIFGDTKMRIAKKVFAILLIIITYIYFITFNGFIKVLNFIYEELNIQTYSIIKLKMMFEQGLAESSSGRDYLFEKFLEQISIHPFFGSGIGITQALWEVSPHNLFLQIMIEFGILGLLISLIFAMLIIFLALKVRKKDNELFLLISIVFSVSFSRLLVSSDIWLRQELWLFISLLINAYLFTNVNIKRQKKIKINL